MEQPIFITVFFFSMYLIYWEPLTFTTLSANSADDKLMIFIKKKKKKNDRVSHRKDSLRQIS